MGKLVELVESVKRFRFFLSSTCRRASSTGASTGVKANNFKDSTGLQIKSTSL